LLISGSPTEHRKHLTDGKYDNDEQWPYQNKLTGTSLDESVIASLPGLLTISSPAHYKTPVTAIVHSIDFVNKVLSEGQYFFIDIEKDGIMFYDDAGNVPLAERKLLTPAEARNPSSHSAYTEIAE
jgi:hypothetical protein